MLYLHLQACKPSKPSSCKWLASCDASSDCSKYFPGELSGEHTQPLQHPQQGTLATSSSHVLACQAGKCMQQQGAAQAHKGSCARLSADNFSFPSLACFMECLRRAREMPSGDQRFQSREQDRHSRARPVTRRCAAFATHASKLQHGGTDQPADHPVIEIVMHASTWGTLL